VHVDAQEPERAQRDIEARSPSAQVWTGECGVFRPRAGGGPGSSCVERYGRIDILIANAGIISVGPIETVRIEDFERAMNVMFWGVLYPIWAVLREMMERQSGKIVTITSIGKGQRSAPGPVQLCEVRRSGALGRLAR
jgi:NAD(P)-dependent dehydrogenase (short-subunit alcohol dehydrogenase family)